MTPYTALKRQLKKEGFTPVDWNDLKYEDPNNSKWVTYRKGDLRILIAKSPFYEHFPTIFYKIKYDWKTSEPNPMPSYKELLGEELYKILSKCIPITIDLPIHTSLLTWQVEKALINSLDLEISRQLADEYYNEWTDTSKHESLRSLFEATQKIKVIIGQYSKEVKQACSKIQCTGSEIPMQELMRLYFRLDSELKRRCAETLASTEDKWRITWDRIFISEFL
jgi:hypothetical protein